MPLDPRIGTLNSGKFYCFPEGNDKPEFVGTREEVEAALGIRTRVEMPAVATKPPIRRWTVKLTFQYPAWDERNGLEFSNILASGKAEANAIARRSAANDGHLHGGKGRATFTATEQ